MNINKNDFKLIIIILIFSIIGILTLNLFKNNNSKIAKVYYNSELILEIDLSNKEEKEYTVKGYNGDVKIITKDGKIKVNSEKSPLHLCSKQGYIENTHESIVCLPNKIVIEIEDNKNEIDTVVK